MHMDTAREGTLYTSCVDLPCSAAIIITQKVSHVQTNNQQAINVQLFYVLVCYVLCMRFGVSTCSVLRNYQGSLCQILC
jgi:hypothetical protein